MEKILLASPLFILRDECEKRLFEVLDDLQALGFDGCELLGFFGRAPEEIARHMRANCFTAMGNHVPFGEFEGDFERVLGDHLTIGVKYITVQLSKEHLPGGEKYQYAADKLESWAQGLLRHGVTLLFHNHAGEFYAVDGQAALKKLMSDVPSLKLEPDLGWMGIAGEDPSEYLRLYSDRSPVLHFKDYYPLPDGRFAFRPTGYGAVRYPEIMEHALNCKPEWIVADHDDAYGRDIYHELLLSLSFIRALLVLAV